MARRLTAALTAALLVSGCASSYPSLLVSAAPPPASPATPGELDKILAEAVALQNEYDAGYKETAKWRDYGQLPIIGAAAWAAWVLLLDKPNAATKVGKIGIGAGAYSAARGQLTSEGITEAYIAGHGAITCVLAEGSNFAGSSAAERFEELDDQLQVVANGVGVVSQYRWVEPSDAAANADTLKAARAVADQAIAGARAAETAALLQHGAFRTAPPVFRNALSSISVRVASKGRVRPAMDFNTLRDTLSPPKAAEGGDAQSLGAGVGNNTAAIVAKLLAETNSLITETARLTGGTPDYTGSLARVRACPETIG